MTERIDIELSGLKREREPDGGPGQWRATFFLQVENGSSVLSITLPKHISDENVVSETKASLYALLRELIDRKTDWQG